MKGVRREVFCSLSSSHRRSSCPRGGHLYKMGRVQPLKLRAQVKRQTLVQSPAPDPAPSASCPIPVPLSLGPEATAWSLAQPSCLNPFCTYQLQSSLDSTSTQDGAATRVSISVLWKE